MSHHSLEDAIAHTFVDAARSSHEARAVLHAMRTTHGLDVAAGLHRIDFTLAGHLHELHRLATSARARATDDADLAAIARFRLEALYADARLARTLSALLTVYARHRDQPSAASPPPPKLAVAFPATPRAPGRHPRATSRRIPAT